MTPEWLTYTNSGATRNDPLSAELQAALGFLADMGIRAEVFSGGQEATGQRTGSTRHDHGNAADVFFYKDGRKLDWSNPQDQPIFAEIVSRGKQAGLTGFGAGPGYMQPGAMHVGFGTPAVWGAGGKGANAPEWLRAAYGAAPVVRGGGGATVAPGILAGLAPPPTEKEKRMGILAELGASLAPQQAPMAQIQPVQRLPYAPTKRDNTASLLRFFQSIG